jgi:hypothetical protein
MSQDSSVGIVTGYELDDRGTGVRFPAGDFFLLHSVQTGSGTRRASYVMGTGGSFPGGKACGHQFDNSPPAGDEAKKMWIYAATSTYAFMA